MIIAHNLFANFTKRQLNINNRSKNTALEKLSSGYRINRAADDAAGLSISEKMRAQIRGLDRGAQNVQDGINMIDTAEGGIGEQIAILQRIRELTVQSYNDTNTEDDRFDIQMEVDALLEEIDRIANDTEFNTIKVLQGDKVSVITEVVLPTEEYSERSYFYSIPIQSKMPDWVTYDNKLTLNNTAVGSGTKQDTSDYVIFNEDQILDSSKEEAAYGPMPVTPDGQPDQNRIDADHWQREWTSGMADNYSARVDFSGLATAKTKEELYERLYTLVGTGIGYECATCEKIQGVCFESSDAKIDRIYNEERSSRSFAHIDLTGLLKQVNGLAEQGESQTDADYEAYIKGKAEGIAKNLVEMVVDKTCTPYGEHFVRTVKDAANPYQVDFYDFRDDGTAEDMLKGKVLDTVSMDIVAQVIVKEKNEPVELTRTEYNSYYIQAGANSRQVVPIDFPDTRLDAIGMAGFSVFPYGYCSVTPDKKYNPNVLIGAQQLGDHLYRKEVGGFPGIVVEETYTVPASTRKVYDTERRIVSDSNGEKKMVMVITGVREETIPAYTEVRKTIVGATGGVMTEFYAYAPDTLLRVDRAIEKLSKDRSYLGAVSNRLDHAYQNDTNTSENLQSAESRIRDADMADEMVSFSIRNILEQSGMAMLAQANRASEGILQLLR